MYGQLSSEPISGEVINYYPFVIKSLLSYQTIKEGKSCSIFILYDKEVSEQELTEFLLKHKPETLTKK